MCLDMISCILYIEYMQMYRYLKVILGQLQCRQEEKQKQEKLGHGERRGRTKKSKKDEKEHKTHL